LAQKEKLKRIGQDRKSLERKIAKTLDARKKIEKVKSLKAIEKLLLLSSSKKETIAIERENRSKLNLVIEKLSKDVTELQNVFREETQNLKINVKQLENQKNKVNHLEEIVDPKSFKYEELSSFTVRSRYYSEYLREKIKSQKRKAEELESILKQEEFIEKRTKTQNENDKILGMRAKVQRGSDRRKFEKQEFEEFKAKTFKEIEQLSSSCTIVAKNVEILDSKRNQEIEEQKTEKRDFWLSKLHLGF